MILLRFTFTFPYIGTIRLDAESNKENFLQLNVNRDHLEIPMNLWKRVDFGDLWTNLQNHSVFTTLTN